MIFFYLLGAIVAFVFLCNLWIRIKAKQYLFKNIENIPKQSYCLVLGVTPVYREAQSVNAILEHRIEAAFDLYQHQKVQRFILSGYDKKRNYNEAEVIKEALIKKGIPTELLQTDSSSYRTYDSLVYCQKHISDTSFTIVSQEFHNYRAVYIAQQLGLNVVAFNAKSQANGNMTLYFKTREYIARCKTIIDFWI